MTILLFAFCIFSIFTVLDCKVVEECGDQCKLINDCACESSNSPIEQNLTPQFVTLVFNDLVLASNYDEYYSKFFLDRKNPDGNPITASFYVLPENSDCDIVNKLYNNGYDINLSIKSACSSEEQIRQNIEKMRKNVSKIANVSIDDIIGIKSRLFGDATFGAYQDVKMSYDNSYVVSYRSRTFPFTLEYKSSLGLLESYPHFWVLPMINFIGEAGRECNSLFSCQIQGTTSEIVQWLFDQFNQSYNTNRAPITILLNTIWFLATPNSEEAFALFLDRLASYKDVFLVGHSEVLRWSRNPVPSDVYETNFKRRSRSCTPANCIYFIPELNESKSARICGTCPLHYPWLENSCEN
ncbi:hypothetical protein FQR65_LT11450 [Abscondita terminalis]|nr:hypothetical protein FQR65_LT11450 [Abscondita terminalis]